MEYCPYVCVKCEQIQENGWELREAYELEPFFECSDFDPKSTYYEADSDTREKLDCAWFQEGDVLDDETELTEENGYQLSLTVCDRCYSNHLQDQNFDAQHQ